MFSSKMFQFIYSYICNAANYTQVNREQIESGESITESFGETERFRVGVMY